MIMTNENVQKQNELIVNDVQETEQAQEEKQPKEQQQAKQKRVYLDYEERMSLEGAASFLETIVSKLKAGQTFTLTHAGQTYEITPAKQVGLEVKYEQKKEGKYKLELELEWREGDGEGLKIG